MLAGFWGIKTNRRIHMQVVDRSVCLPVKGTCDEFIQGVIGVVCGQVANVYKVGRLTTP